MWIPVYTVKGFTTCVPQFLEHATGIHPPDAGSDVRTSPAGGRPFSSPDRPATAVSELFSGISSVSLHISTATKRVKCFIEHMLCIVLGVCMHNLRTGPNNKTFYKLTYVHTLAQISTAHCTIISLTSRSAIMFDKLPGDCVHLAVLRSTSLIPG